MNTSKRTQRRKVIRLCYRSLALNRRVRRLFTPAEHAAKQAQVFGYLRVLGAA